MSDKFEALSRLNFEKWIAGDYSPDRSPEATSAGEDAFKSVMWHIYSSAQLPLLAALEEANSKNYLADMLEWRRKAEEVDKRMVTQNRHVCELFDEAKMLRDRAEATGRREEHLKATVDVLSAKNAELERTNAAQDDHINQQQDRIDTLEKRNGELGKHVGKLEKLLKGTEESLIASVDNVAELEQRLQQPIPARGSVEVNDAAWKLHDMLTEHGSLNGHQFNNLKGCFYEALKTCFKVEGE